ncbi:Uma2 family endonuclease [Planococcus sp. A6]|uniref:Uma2 family endonuclease n=1 Tax=Planococcus sp. A6 TaxID=2992760 RepID=UPI00237A83B2|nr:Uma2 family endonuclease [Planococcus sp. A6]MDE0582020.1 Uma2 family endonuclease [Planococcus sp. A6]
MDKDKEKVENDMQHPAPSIDTLEGGLSFKRAREKRGITRTEAAELSKDVSASYIFRIEEGSRKPSLSVVQKLADIYEVSTETLLGLAVAEDRCEERKGSLCVGYPSAERTYTYREYLELPGRWELIKGIPYKMRSPDMLHQRLTARICVAIGSYISAHLGNNKQEVFTAPYEVRLSKTGDLKHIDTVVQPDLSVVFYERFDEKVPRPPHLVVEVLSLDTVFKDRTTKLELYRKSGVHEYWIADPLNKTIDVYNFQAEGQEEKKFVSKEGILQSSYLADFKFPIHNFFD